VWFFIAYIIKTALMIELTYVIIPSYEDHDWYYAIYAGLILLTIIGIYTEYK
jgi:hypothetical protein